MAYNVLYISYDGMTDPLGQSQVLPYLIGLSKAGFNIHLLSCEKDNAYNENAEVIKMICAGNNISWHPLKYTKSPPLLSTLFDMQQLKRRAEQIHKSSEIHITHCRSYIPAIIGAALKKKYGIKLIFDMRGFWPDERVDGNLWNLKNPVFKLVYQYFKRKEKELLQIADHTISLTHEGKEEIHSWKFINNNPVPITVIPCCVDLDHFDPDNIKEDRKNTLRAELGLNKNECVISYVGSIGTWYMLDEMLAFFKVFHKHVSHARFLFITTDEPAKIAEKAKQYGIGPARIVVVKGSRKNMPVLISLSNYSIFFIKPVYSKKASSPTKQGEIMRLGIPIICNDKVGDTSFIINKYKAGIILTSFGEESYNEGVRKLLSIQFDNKNIINGAFDFYNLQTGIIKYENIYNSLLA
ncbi:MAG: glycosyltransferase [Mucilaginibacter sp.]